MTDASMFRTVYQKRISTCTLCLLHKHRSQPVAGIGDTRRRIVIIGEAPGPTENTTGRPFSGITGNILTSMLETIGLSRNDCYITNAVKCFPERTRRPSPNERTACINQFLIPELAAIQPRLIITLGDIATAIFSEQPLAEIHGKRLTIQGCYVVPTFHPTLALTNPRARQAIWDDLKTVNTILDEFESTPLPEASNAQP